MFQNEKLCLMALLLLLGAGCSTSAESEPSSESAGNAPIPPTNAPTTVAAVGDIMLGGTARPELRRYGYDYPFEHVATLLQDADIAFGNLEGPLTDAGAPEGDKQYVFRSPPAKVVPALKRAGFDVLSLANNHSLDYGPHGLADTEAALRAHGIAAIGAGVDARAARAPAVVEARGKKLGFLAYSLTLPENFFATDNRPGTAFGHEDQVRADVAALKSRVDFVLVSFHWGQEGKTELRDYQVRVGHAAIEAGAHAVIGHHPHILQGVERYRDGVILYSLGNFVFGSYSRSAIRSVVAQLLFDDRGLREVRLVPINVNNIAFNFQPKLLSPEAAAVSVTHLQTLSRPLGTELANEDGVAVLRLPVVATPSAHAGER